MTPRWWPADLGVGSAGPPVRTVQRKLGMDLTGVYDEATVWRVRGFQVRHRLPVTGIVDEETAVALGHSPLDDMTPTWFKRPLRRGHSGFDVEYLREALGCSNGWKYDDEVDAAVRRMQSAYRMTPTGEVDEDLAILLGE